MQFLMSEPGSDPIIVEGWFRALPERVFRAWTTPDELMQWFGHSPNSLLSAEVDLRIGGAYRFSFPPGEGVVEHGFEGVYETIKPTERLVFTWRRFVRHASGEEELWPYSRVEVAFSAKGAGTQVRLEHAALDTDDKLRNVSMGWNGAFGNLQTLFDGE